MVHLTLNIAAFALWLLEVIFWAVVSVAGWIALAVGIGAVVVIAVRRWIGRPRP